MAKATAMKKYQVLGGHYVSGKSGSEVRHDKGTVFESKDMDLASKFPGAIGEYHGPEVAAATPEGKNDVTPDFPAAAESNLTVLSKGRDYWVYDQGDAPLNESALRKGAVASFIEDYMGS